MNVYYLSTIFDYYINKRSLMIDCKYLLLCSANISMYIYIYTIGCGTLIICFIYSIIDFRTSYFRHIDEIIKLRTL